MLKICNRCFMEQPLENFFKNKLAKDGRINQCKTCRKKDFPYETNEKTRGITRKYRQSEKGLLKTLLERAKQRSRQFNVVYNLDEEWLKEKLKLGICELSGIKFEFTNNPIWRANPFCPSIDRIIPSFGYTKENSRLICFCINMAKSDWSDEILFKMCQEIINYNKALINN